MSKAFYVVTHYATTNDVNGNPRRCMVARKASIESDYAEVVAVVDEGYGGTQLSRFDGDLPVDAPLNVDSVRVNVTPGQYREFLRIGKQLSAARKMKAAP